MGKGGGGEQRRGARKGAWRGAEEGGGEGGREGGEGGEQRRFTAQARPGAEKG